MKIFNKSRIAWTISALFLVAVTSCSKDKTVVQSPSAGQILFTSEQAGLTVKSALNIKSDFVADAGLTLKTTINGVVTSWIAGTDKTGIYCPQAYTLPNNSGTNPILNNQYSAKTTAASSDFTPLNAMYWGGGAGTSHNFYAYYPFSGSFGSPAAASVPVGLLDIQSQLVANDSTHIGGLDFLVASPVVVVAPDNTSLTENTVHLTYNHLFSIVQFDIYGSGTISGISLSGTDLAVAGALIDITQVTPTPGVAYKLANGGSKTGTVIVNLATAATLSLTTPTKVYMVIYPGYAGFCTIEFLNGGSWKNSQSKPAPTGGFVRGQKYVVTVNAGAL